MSDIIKKTVEVLLHTISYSYDNGQDISDSDTEHVAYMITQGFREGDLTDDGACSGHWEIQWNNTADADADAVIKAETSTDPFSDLYIQAGSKSCPFCNSEDGILKEQPTTDCKGDIIRFGKCLSYTCGKSWVENFKMTSVEEVTFNGSTNHLANENPDLGDTSMIKSIIARCNKKGWQSSVRMLVLLMKKADIDSEFRTELEYWFNHGSTLRLMNLCFPFIDLFPGQCVYTNAYAGLDSARLYASEIQEPSITDGAIFESLSECEPGRLSVNGEDEPFDLSGIIERVNRRVMQLGYNDCCRGLSLDTNPYPSSFELADKWIEGFNIASDFIQGKSDEAEHDAFSNAPPLESGNSMS